MPITKDDEQGGLVRDPIKALGMRPRTPKTVAAVGPVKRTPTAGQQRQRAAKNLVPSVFRDPIATAEVKHPNLPPERDQFGRTAAGRAHYLRVTRAVDAGKMPALQGRMELQQAGLLPHLKPSAAFDKHGHRIGSTGLGAKMTTELFRQIVGLPAVPFVAGAAAAHDVLNPGQVEHGNSHVYNRVLKPVGESFKESATHPLRDPLMTAENTFAALSAGAGTIAKAGSVAEAMNATKLAAAAQGERAGVGAVAKSVVRGVREAKSKPIVTHVPGKDGETVAIRSTRSKNELVNIARRVRAARDSQGFGTMKGAGALPSKLLATYGSPEARVGKVLARHNAVEQQLLDSQANGLGRYHRTVGRVRLGRNVLSDAEQKALDIAASHGRQIVGDAGAVRDAVTTHRLYHANAAEHAAVEQQALEQNLSDIQDAVAAGDDAEVKRLMRQRAKLPSDYGTVEGHDAQIALSKAAEQHLMKPGKRLQEALQRVPAVGEQREHMLEQQTTLDSQGQENSRLAEDRQLYRLGARHLELTHGARGVETPLQELERLKAEQTNLERLRKSKTATKIEQLQQMLEKVQKARDKRGGAGHAAAVADLKRQLDEFTARYGPLVNVLGARGANDLLQERGTFGRVFHAPAGRKVEEASATAPHTLESAKEEHARMQQTYDAVFGRYVLGKDFVEGKPLRDQYGLEPTALSEQRFRNTSNGIRSNALKALEAGKRGPKGGSAALRRGFLPNVKDQLLRAHESQMHDFMEERAAKGDEFAKRFLAHHERMVDLGNGISTLEEHRAFGGAITPDMEAEVLGERKLPVKQTVPDQGAEAVNVRPTLSKSAIATVERKSQRAGATLRKYADLDAHEKAVRDAINQLAGNRHGRKFLRLVATEEDRHGRMAAIRDDLVASGRVVRDMGGFYVPSHALHDVEHAGQGYANASEFGFGPGNTKLASLDKEYKAALERQGNQRTDVTRLTEEGFREAAKLHTLTRGFRSLWGMSKQTIEEAGGHEFAVPIRATPNIPAPLRRVMARVVYHGLTAEEEAKLPPGELEGLRDYLFPSKDSVNAASNLTRDGVPVRWIDSREADAFVRRAARGTRALKIGSKELTGGDVLDSVNNVFRAGVLYTKPAYALNLLQGLGTNVLQQGVFLPSNIARSFRLGRDLGWEDQHRIFALMGEGASRALDGETHGWMAQSVHHASGFWNVVVDRLPRVTAFIHEARRMGYKTPEDMHRLLNDEAARDDLYEIHQRANQEAIDYSMTPIEKASLRRLFFFYPWLRGATLWSLRFPREHPIQTALYAPLAEDAAKRNEKELGPLPSYADSLLKIGGTDKVPSVVNPGNLNNFQTFADVVKGGAGVFQGGSPDAAKLSGELGPFAGFLYTLLSGKNALGHDLPPGESHAAGAVHSVIDSLPPAVLYSRATRDNAQSRNPAKQGTYIAPPTALGKLEQAAEQYGGAGLVPRDLNKPAAAAKHETEVTTELGAEGSNAYRYGHAYDQVGKVWPQVEKLMPAGYDKSAFNKQVVQQSLDTQLALDQHLFDYAKSHGLHSPQDLGAQQRLGVVAAYLEAHPHPGLDHQVIEQTLAALQRTPAVYRDEVAARLYIGLRHASGSGMVNVWKRLLKQVGVPYAGPKG